jgi:hypothetical protein
MSSHRSASGFSPAVSRSAVNHSPPRVRLSSEESAAQVGPRAALVVLRPQQRRERVAAVALPCHCQISEEGHRLAPGDVNRLTVELEARWSEEIQSQPRHMRATLQAPDFGSPGRLPKSSVPVSLQTLARWRSHRSVSGMTEPSVLQIVQNGKIGGRATLAATVPASISRRSTARLIVNQEGREEVGNAQVTIGRCRSTSHRALSQHRWNQGSAGTGEWQ